MLAANDAAAVLGVDENRDVLALDDDVPRAEARSSLVMGPTHCAFDGCTGAFANACGHGESFCIIHRTQF